MSTSLAEQLRRLKAPQTSLLTDSKKRASILFDLKEAANKDRKTIFDLGHTGLMQLIELNPTFIQFEQTLFDQASIKLERSVESDSVNKLLNKVIRKFFYQLSPYFMLQPAHLCLEWLIRRFHIHEFNKSDFIALILPYHETKIFIKCIQILNLQDPNDQWKWLEPIQKPGVALSKNAIFNRAASDPTFLEFICKFTRNAIKELGNKANNLQAQINFYYTTIIGGFENLNDITESHILNVLPSILKGLSSKTIDYTAAALMITSYMCYKTKLSQKILQQLIGKICNIEYSSMYTDVILALIVIFRNQLETLNEFPQQHLVNFVQKKWITTTLRTLSMQSINIGELCNYLVGGCLRNVQAKSDGWNECRRFLEQLITEVEFKNSDANNLIRTVLYNYQRIEAPKKSFVENEVIELDSDTEMESDINIQMWYSKYLQELEKQYSTQFDNTIKQVLQEDTISESRKHALRTVLAYRLKSSFFNDNTSIYESLYHYNVRNRVEGIQFLVQNIKTLNLSSDNQKLLGESLVDRLKDDNPEVVYEILKLSSEELVKLIDNKEIIENLIEILCKSLLNPIWNDLTSAILNHLTRKIVYKGTDLNRIFLAIVPCLFPTNQYEYRNANIILKSEFTQELPILRRIACSVNDVKPEEMAYKVTDCLCIKNELPEFCKLLQSFDNINEDRFVKSYNFAYLLTIFEVLYDKNTSPEVGIRTIKFVLKLANKFQLVPGVEEKMQFLIVFRENKVPLFTLLQLLIKIVQNTSFGNLQKFKFNSKPLQLYLQIYEYLITNAFTKSKRDGNDEYFDALKRILNCCFSNAEEKLKFLANFFIVDFIPNSNEYINSELQIRSMRLFDMVAKGNDRTYEIDEEIFAKLLLALSSKTSAIRECTLKVIETILNSNGLDSKLKTILIKILDRSEEIRMHEEHLALILVPIVLAKKKESNQEEKSDVTYCLSLILSVITDTNTEYYLKAHLFSILKHVPSKKIFKNILDIGLEILQAYDKLNSSDSDNDLILTQAESKIMKLIALRYDVTTIKLLLEEPMLWEFIEKSLKLHKLILLPSDQITENAMSIASLIVDIFDQETYEEMPEKFKKQFHDLLINAVTFNDRDNQFGLNAKKFFKHIDLDCQHILPILEKMKSICNTTVSNLSSGAKQTRNRELKNIAPDSYILNSSEWKNGITMLEFLQNKKKLKNFKILIPLLFEILKNCVTYEEQFHLEYAKQLILSCLLLCCQKLTDLPQKHHELQESDFKIESIVQCISATQNSQTHHHALLLLSHCATFVPQQVLYNMMNIFTFMGSSVVRHEDAFSFQIISNIIESVIPTLIRVNSAMKAQQKGNGEFDDKLVIPVLKVFADVILDVPEHRRLLLYTKLIRTLGAEKYLWMFLCILFECHVMHSENKKKKDPKSSYALRKSNFSNFDEVPERLEIALQILKDFEPVTTIETCTSLFAYLSGLPLEKIDDEKSMQIDVTDSTIFDVDAHSAKQLRHYRYIILQLINSFLSSTEFVNHNASFNEDEMIVMKPHYQNLIIKILSYIPDVIKIMECKDTVQMKYWKLILHYCYDILDSAISLLSADLLLIVVHGLMNHKLIAVRKKIIDILIDKLQHKPEYFENCNEENMLRLLDPLIKIFDSISSTENLVENASTNEVIYLQQTALIAIKILSKLLALKHPDQFKEILVKLTNIIRKHQNLPKILLATIALAIAEVSSNLRAHSIVHLPKFMPLLIELIEDQLYVLKNQPPDSVCIALITGIQKIFEVLPLFLGPYIVDILMALIKIWIFIVKYQEEDPKTNVILTKLTTIWSKIAKVIPLRILLPSCEKIYTRCLEEKQYLGVVHLMNLIKETFNNSSSADVQSMQTEITKLFLNILTFREQFADTIDTKSIEESIIQAFVTLTLKLSESSFRPLYQKVYDWAIREKLSKENSITYFHLSSKIGEALQLLFLDFASDFIQDAANLLDNCNSIKSNELYFTSIENDAIHKNSILIEHILRTLFNIFLYDSKNFINPHRFDILMQPIVDQLENPLVLSNQRLRELLVSTLAQMAVAVSNDTLWKQLNYQVLLKTRSNSSDIRILSFNCCVEIARKLGEDFNSLLPETIPFIAELFEDDVQEVEKSCKKGVQELEKILGESLQKYF